MKIKMALVSLVMALVITGCGTQPSISSNSSDQINATSATAQTNTTASTQVYSVAEDIYNKVKTAVGKNSEATFDSELSKITNVGQSSSPTSPNGVLYEDAATVVALDDGMNAEGSPAHAYDDLLKAMDKMKNDLAKYKPSGD
ncbi:hypothetical protein [Alicyclobacillus dauci]|uniref:Lipoprotein n=1 Tax=Alicyclobacillus dauci TaxID=1475485 RepID=A0ABY6Z7Y0_9BACL|nr:hypothetical protein [Alicyclobacillus dauci]WAH38276.1 hypothetical protein NZD86_07275 [Alicyclobacillus dauci]